MEKSVIITGANVGIGFAAARYFAGIGGWHVVLACRNAEKGETARSEIQRLEPGASVSTLRLDLYSLESVQAFVEAVCAAEHPPIHALVLNAGGINMKARELEFSSEGFERTFQLNFLGHFVLTQLLLNQLAHPARIVFVSSDLHDPAATRMGKLTPPRYGAVADAALARGPFAKMSPMARYATAKMFAIMCAYELDRRLKEVGLGNAICVNSWSPGVVPTTQAGRDMPALLKLIMTSAWFVKLMGSHLATEEEAARSLGRLILDPKFARTSGRYFDGDREIPSSIESRDPSKARDVWEQTTRLAVEAHPNLVSLGRLMPVLAET
ncbi:MAG TPA: SDR family NAD(P)-dependent oxidoreductase [Chthonomonadaceae bacterium]|nr:SDR family NAD(P)-dependent oxidoreductase [Chthonomonadaceae bacterium]